MRTYRYLAAAVGEREALVPKEKAALINAEAKLAALGPSLPYPHSSAVHGEYRQIGREFIVAAVGPEAQADGRGFAAACRRAEARLAEIEDEGQ